MTSLAALARFARAGRDAPGADARCDLCAAPLHSPHAHVADVPGRRLFCACAACAHAFTATVPGTRFRTVPTRVLRDTGAPLDDEVWSLLDIPVRLAFVFLSTATGNACAAYPSPAGATETLLDPEHFSAFAARCRLVRAVAPDVEALLVRGVDDDPARYQHLLVPIDACYELVARVRSSWKGFDGAGLARRTASAFFDELAARSRPYTPPASTPDQEKDPP